jgi:hypothetical protein
MHAASLQRQTCSFSSLLNLPLHMRQQKPPS